MELLKGKLSLPSHVGGIKCVVYLLFLYYYYFASLAEDC